VVILPAIAWPSQDAALPGRAGAFDRWIEPSSRQTFTELAREELQAP